MMVKYCKPFCRFHVQLEINKIKNNGAHAKDGHVKWGSTYCLRFVAYQKAVIQAVWRLMFTEILTAAGMRV